MRIWFDADNAPHALIMRPLVEELVRRGHEVRFTARNRTSTCELLDSYGISYTMVGTEYGAGTVSKIIGTLKRSLALIRAMRSWKPDVSFGHGSRSLPIASCLMGVPSVTMYDYEWVNATVFNRFCRSILLPEAVDHDRCAEAGINLAKVRHFPGLKEELYLKEFRPDGEVAADLGLTAESVAILMRPPATSAHYHNAEAETRLKEILDKILAREDVQLVFLPREANHQRYVESRRQEHGNGAQVIIPDKVYDGPQLVHSMDLVISGGGTMTREAAVLGVPSYSFFRGRLGRVDESLEQMERLIILRSRADVQEKLRIAKKDCSAAAARGTDLAGHIVAEILRIAV